MAIDFFKSECRQKTKAPIFGIYDAPPATLLFYNEEDWVVWVDNDQEKEIIHTAIDGCVDIPDNEGERCESMLTYDDVIIFLELKDRDGGRWAGKARDQLLNTIALFRRDANIDIYSRRYAHIANKQRPHFRSAGKKFSQEFEDRTGFILRISEVLKIQ